MLFGANLAVWAQLPPVACTLVVAIVFLELKYSLAR